MFASFNVIDDFEHRNLSFSLSFVFIDMCKDLGDLGQSKFELRVIRVGRLCLLQDLSQQQTVSGKSLDGSDEQFLESLSQTFWFAFIPFEENMELLGLCITFDYGPLSVFKEVYKSRVCF